MRKDLGTSGDTHLFLARPATANNASDRSRAPGPATQRRRLPPGNNSPHDNSRSDSLAAPQRGIPGLVPPPSFPWPTPGNSPVSSRSEPDLSLIHISEPTRLGMI